MKKFVGILVVVSLMTGVAAADLINDGLAHVQVTLDKTVIVGDGTAQVSTSVQQGEIKGDEKTLVVAVVTFPIRSNQQALDLFVEATSLWKGNVVLGYEIPIDFTEPVGVEMAEATANGGVNSLLWPDATADATLKNLPSFLTEEKGWHAGSPTALQNEDVVVTVQWDATQDPTKPLLPDGEYSGWVKLVCTTL